MFHQGVRQSPHKKTIFFFAALPHFIIRLKGSVLEEASSRKKKKKDWATSSTPINLSNAPDKTEFGKSDEAIYNKLPFTCKGFYHYLVIAGKG